MNSPFYNNLRGSCISRVLRARNIMASMFARLVFGIAFAAALACCQATDTRDRDFWNGKFSDPNTQFNRRPSRLLVEVLRNRKPGSAIDLGMGEGRNAIYLAQQGWQVTGVDLSDVAVAQAKKRAEQLHLNLTAVVENLDHYDFGKSRWDLVTLFYTWARVVSQRKAQECGATSGGAEARRCAGHRGFCWRGEVHVSGQ